MRPNALRLKAGIGHLSLDDQARQKRPHKLLDLELLKSEGRYGCTGPREAHYTRATPCVNA